MRRPEEKRKKKKGIPASEWNMISMVGFRDSKGNSERSQPLKKKKKKKQTVIHLLQFVFDSTDVQSGG